MVVVREKNTRPTTAIARSLMETNFFTGILLKCCSQQGARQLGVVALTLL
jgi:hypothetical protein